jgi:hypothetical protein
MTLINMQFGGMTRGIKETPETAGDSSAECSAYAE